MKKAQNLTKSRSILKNAIIVTALFSVNLLNAQSAYKFSTAGATGNIGPTQTQLDSSYASSNLFGKVESNYGIQTFTVPVSGLYHIEARGAQGGGDGTTKFGGKGVSMQGDFNFAAGTVLKILVGHQGSSGSGCYGGGGGSFVTDILNTPLIIAGGGGGAGGVMGGNGIDASTGLNGTAGVAGGSGGTNGSGGTAINTNAGSGGGFYSDGTGSFYMPQCSTNVGKSFLNGCEGGQFDFWLPGGFGGGGSGWDGNGNGGGGGGYSGGGTSGSSFSAGGGAGSYNSGTNQLNIAGANTGDGQIIITEITTTGITALNNNYQINLYPNPFTNKITVITNGEERATLQIVNALGAVVHSEKMVNSKTEIDLSEQASGIYFVKIGSVTRRVVKE